MNPGESEAPTIQELAAKVARQEQRIQALETTVAWLTQFQQIPQVAIAQGKEQDHA